MALRAALGEDFPYIHPPTLALYTNVLANIVAILLPLLTDGVSAFLSELAMFASAFVVLPACTGPVVVSAKCDSRLS